MKAALLQMVSTTDVATKLLKRVPSWQCCPSIFVC